MKGQIDNWKKMAVMSLRKGWGKLDVTYRRSIAYALALHAAVILALSIGWHSKADVKPIAAPRHINTVVVDASTIEALTVKKQREEDQKAAEKKRKQDEIKKKEQALKRKKEELRKKKELEKKRVQEKKRQDEEARKKALLKKKEEQRKLEALKKREEIKKLEAEKKKQEAKKLKAEKERLEAEQQKARERQLQEMMLKAEQQRQLELEAKRLEQQRIAQEQLEQAQFEADRIAEMSEVDRFKALILAKITRQWHKPSSAKVGMTVGLRLYLFPTGELNRVEIFKSSGNVAYDNSALSAAKSISQYPVPSNSKIFENNFRQFTMLFVHQEG